jgi:hypothetical protein
VPGRPGQPDVDPAKTHLLLRALVDRFKQLGPAGVSGVLTNHPRRPAQRSHRSAPALELPLRRIVDVVGCTGGRVFRLAPGSSSSTSAPCRSMVRCNVPMNACAFSARSFDPL